jgi:hypothetical protein
MMPLACSQVPVACDQTYVPEPVKKIKFKQYNVIKYIRVNKVPTNLVNSSADLTFRKTEFSFAEADNLK